MAVELLKPILRSGTIAISQIVIGERKRELGDITSLAQSIKELGLLNPITILPDGSLVAGRHRIEACKRLGWSEIPANVVNLDSLNAELAEIDENLIRNELHWFDRDKQLARRKEIYLSLHPETSVPGRGKNQHVPSDIMSLGTATFAEDTASKVGTSDRTIERSIQRANTFTEEQGEVLKKAAIPQTDATKLARFDEPKRQAVIEVIASGKATNVKDAASVVRQEEKQQAYQNTVIVHDDRKVYQCSVAALHLRVDPDSLDAIITDPPYPREYLSVYADLAEFASYALKPGGSLVAMVGQSYLPEIIDMLKKYLKYHWTACYFTPGPATQIWQRSVNCSFKPLLWFVKGEYTGTWISDVFKSEARDKDFHEWGQSESGMVDIVDRFSLPGQLICDPFVGGGATAIVAANMKRRFVGCDVDESCVQKTLQRVNEVLV